MHLRFKHVALLAGAFVLCLNVEAAWAWGPATHIHLAHRLLSDLHWLPTSMAALISRYAVHYLYGNIAADVVFAKRWSRVKQFCHHWTTGFRLLEGSRTDADEAFSLGYLSHLAADTVAHGKYVPRQLAVTRSTMNFGHLYWEARADHLIPSTAYTELRALDGHDFRVHHDRMAGVLTETFLPHAMNVLLFRRLNRVVVGRQWRTSVGLWGRHSRWVLPVELLRQYHDESLERMVSVMVEQERSAVLHEDPNGTSALQSVSHNRRHVRLLQRRGLPLDHVVRDAAASYGPDPRHRAARV